MHKLAREESVRGTQQWHSLSLSLSHTHGIRSLVCGATRGGCVSCSLRDGNHNVRVVRSGGGLEVYVHGLEEEGTENYVINVASCEEVRARLSTRTCMDACQGFKTERASLREPTGYATCVWRNDVTVCSERERDRETDGYRDRWKQPTEIERQRDRERDTPQRLRESDTQTQTHTHRHTQTHTPREKSPPLSITSSPCIRLTQTFRI